ncbi:MAG: hypothetical protein F4X57_00085 [Chloroflexi bacterium]|nr:hypothetical protein [Chloroflexota bacterium]
MAFFENEPTGVLLRLPESMVTEDTEYIPFRTTLYEDPRVVEFVNFMLHVIVSATDGKVSPKSIWNEWLGRPQDSAIDRAEMKAGISFEHVQQLFTDVFDAGDRVRGRLNGEVQRVWEGFMLIPPRAEYTLRPAPAGTPATTAVPGRNLREDTDKADAESDKITLEVLYDGPTPAKFRYRFDDALMSVTMYLDKGSVAEPRRPRAYRITAEPIYE